MRNFNLTNKFKVVLLATFLLFMSHNLHAQYKLELEWQKTIANGYFISSLTKSDNDSLLYTSGGEGTEGPFTNYILNSKDGTIIDKFASDFAYYPMYAKKDGSLIAVGTTNASSIGIVDPKTFEITFWSKVPNYRFFTYNEKQNKIVANSSASLIRVYDLNTKEIVKEFTSSYFKFSDLFIEQANITDDGKNIIYSYWTSYRKQDRTQGIINYIRIIDMEGNVLKKIDSTSSTKFTITNDGKTLVYFDPNGTQLLDLETMKLKEGIPNAVPGYGDDPNCIELSNNDKFMLIAGGVLFLDLIDKKRIWLHGGNGFTWMKLNSTNSSLYCNASAFIMKFNFQQTSSVNSYQDKVDFQIQVLENNIMLSTQKEISPNLKFRIISLDGKIQKQILPHQLDITTNTITINILSLLSGIYFLEITDNQSIVYSSKFSKTN